MKKKLLKTKLAAYATRGASKKSTISTFSMSDDHVETMSLSEVDASPEIAESKL